MTSTELVNGAAGPVAQEATSPRWLAWVSTVLWCQLFLVEYLVSGSWRGQYSYRNNYISELGVMYCAGDSCSVSFPLLNLSMVLVGIGTALWGVVLWRNPQTRNCAVLLLVASVGAVISGAIPTNINWPWHSGGADAFFMFAPTAVLSLCVFDWRTLGPGRYVMLALSGVSVACLLVYLQGVKPSFGIGILERGIVYSALLAMVIGVWITAHRGTPAARHRHESSR
jgi:hypothetical membrane protein